MDFPPLGPQKLSHLWRIMLKLCHLITGIAVALIAIMAAGASASAAEAIAPPAAKPGTSEADFFESKIRPLFAARCKECHGDKKQEMGLRVDRREAFFRGGDDGPVVVPGNPEKSPLIDAVQHNGDIQMPPDTKLADHEIAALTTWVKLGAPWPEDLHSDAAVNPSKDAKNHWAFQPLQRPALPEIKKADWVNSPIDQFILAKLESAGLQPSPAADKPALVRRAYFDLLGLPPTPEEVEAFVADNRPNAFELLVDRLLESPHYGERWGRYWLDIARYADNKGYVFEADRDYPHAYLYRDWVVQALNDDLPYDQFLMRQLAADRLSRDDDSSLAAMGFLTLGRRFLNNKHDIIDDRLDVVFRGTQGLTISCARCHDHKYDPIPTADYYSMYGVLDDSEENTVALEEPSEEYRAELAKREAAQRDFIATERAKLLSETKSKTAQYLLAAHAQKGKADEDQFLFVQTDVELKPTIVARWRTYLDGRAKDTPQVWTLWRELCTVKSDEFQAKLAAMLEATPDAVGKTEINKLLLAEIRQKQPKALDELSKCYATVLKIADDQWQQELEAAKGKEAPKQLADADAEQLRLIYYRKDGPFDFDEVVFKFLLSVDTRKQLDKLRADIIQWQNSDKAPRHAYVLEDKRTQSQPRVFVRGNPGNPGQAVPKQFPGVVAAGGRKPFTSGSGRLEMAKIIASPTNPLTARVMVNRVWMYHFCAPLVDTPSDFGTRSESPTHPELLDYLADEFIKTGWSLKTLHRDMMLSATYRQASLDRTDGEAVDPNNRLLWRMNRRRLDWEALRDSIAFVSGELDLNIGGKSVDMFAVRTRSSGNGVKPIERKKGDSSDSAAPRRTIYGFIDRQNLPGVLRTFDFALPDTHSPKRFSTVVPPQALYLMNNPFVAECAADFARRKEIASIDDETKRIERMYAVAFGRPATDGEVSLARQFLQQQRAGGEAKRDGDKFDSWDRLAQAIIMTNEFAFVD
jgi:hypothetical protein